jgi:quercetin dioxygenase-like cupin family protein
MTDSADRPAAGGLPPEASELPNPNFTEISRHYSTMSGQPINLPTGEIEVIASLYSIPPGEELPFHRHSYPRYGYVLSGELTVKNDATNHTKIFKKGEFAVEAIQQWHKGISSGVLPLELLVIDQLPPGANNIEIRSSEWPSSQFSRT